MTLSTGFFRPRLEKRLTRTKYELTVPMPLPEPSPMPDIAADLPTACSTLLPGAGIEEFQSPGPDPLRSRACARARGAIMGAAGTLAPLIERHRYLRLPLLQLISPPAHRPDPGERLGGGNRRGDGTGVRRDRPRRDLAQGRPAPRPPGGAGPEDRHLPRSRGRWSAQRAGGGRSGRLSRARTPPPPCSAWSPSPAGQGRSQGACLALRAA